MVIRGSLILFLLICGFTSLAQTLGQTAITPFVLQAATPEIQVHATLGEIVANGQQAALSEGFPQAIEKVKLQIVLTDADCFSLAKLHVEAKDSCATDLTLRINGVEQEEIDVPLEAGVYAIQITAPHRCAFDTTFTLPEPIDCGLQFFNAIAPNGSEEDQVWSIANITQDSFKENQVSILNRWGVEVWSGNNYDNEEVVWRGKTQGGEDLADGTYFYVVKIGDEVFTGFIELLR